MLRKNFITLFLLLLFSGNMYAYIDPGSGSAITAAIIAFISGIYFYIKKYYFIIKKFIKNQFNSKKRQK